MPNRIDAANKKKIEVAAKKPVEVAAKKAPAAKAKLAAIGKRDEMSTGKGSALKARGLKATGASIKVNERNTGGRRFSVSELLAARAKAAPTAVASTLRTEVRGDGNVNCLERAVK